MTYAEATGYKEQIEDMGLTHVTFYPTANDTRIKVEYMHIVYGQWVTDTAMLRTQDDCEFFLEKCSDGLILDLPISIA